MSWRRREIRLWSKALRPQRSYSFWDIAPIWIMAILLVLIGGPVVWVLFAVVAVITGLIIKAKGR